MSAPVATAVCEQRACGHRPAGDRGCHVSSPSRSNTHRSSSMGPDFGAPAHRSRYDLQWVLTRQRPPRGVTSRQSQHPQIVQHETLHWCASALCPTPSSDDGVCDERCALARLLGAHAIHARYDRQVCQITSRRTAITESSRVHLQRGTAWCRWRSGSAGRATAARLPASGPAVTPACRPDRCAQGTNRNLQDSSAQE